jgi:AcrR family transcriptional regulator
MEFSLVSVLAPVDRRMLPSMTPPRGGRRLSVDDWIEAGFAVLADSGPNALRVDALCARLNVTKGSFYWHFTDMAAYRSALVDAWGGLHDRGRRPFENMPHVDPRERLAVMMGTLVAPHHWALERAMRVWALTDDAALAAVQQSDERVLRAVRQAFDDCGFEPEEAALRSFVVFSAGVGLLHSSVSAPAAPPDLQDRFLDFMLRP